LSVICRCLGVCPANRKKKQPGELIYSDSKMLGAVSVKSHTVSISYLSRVPARPAIQAIVEEASGLLIHPRQNFIVD